MKRKHFLLGALAFVALGTMTSCSNEDIVGSGGTAAEEVGERYMAIRISATGTSSRAGDKLASDPANEREYEIAEVDIENKIAGPEDLRFYFFTENGEPFYLSQTTVNGTVSHTNMVTPQKITPVYNQQGNETTSKQAVLVLGTPENPHVGTVPKLVLVAANLSDDDFTALADKDLEKTAEQLTTYGEVADINDKDTPFKMTTAVYAQEVSFGSKYKEKMMRAIVATLIPTECIGKTPKEAEAHPVVCNIERLAAKVRVKGLDVYPVKERPILTNEDGTIKYDEDGNIEYGDPVPHEYEWVDLEEGTGNTVIRKGFLYMKLTGWKLCDVYKNVRLIKYITPHSGDSDPFPNWNDPANKRCYWAVTPAASNAGQLLKTDINIYNAADFPYQNYNPDADPEKGENRWAVYVTPNAAMDWQPSSDTDREQSSGTGTAPGSTTAIVVRGQVCTNEAGTQTIDLMRWSGTYYTPAALKELVAQAYNATLKPGDIRATRNNVVFVPQTGEGKDPNKYVAGIKLTSTEAGIELNSDGSKPMNDFSDISWWQQGGCTSYWQNIKHAEKADGTPLYGVIRNHIYDYNMTGVVGLGVPGNSRENPDPEDESYVACEVHVLNWRVLSKDVVLE